MRLRSLRFAFILFALLFAGVTLVSEVATAAIYGATVIEGTGTANDFQIIGGKHAVRGGLVYQTELLCNPCEVRVSLQESDVIVVGGGVAGPLNPYHVYDFGTYRGRLGIQPLALGEFLVHFDGEATFIRAG